MQQHYSNLQQLTSGTCLLLDPLTALSPHHCTKQCNCSPSDKAARGTAPRPCVHHVEKDTRRPPDLSTHPWRCWCDPSFPICLGDLDVGHSGSTGGYTLVTGAGCALRVCPLRLIRKQQRCVVQPSEEQSLIQKSAGHCFETTV